MLVVKWEGLPTLWDAAIVCDQCHEEISSGKESVVVWSRGAEEQPAILYNSCRESWKENRAAIGPNVTYGIRLDVFV